MSKYFRLKNQRKKRFSRTQIPNIGKMCRTKKRYRNEHEVRRIIKLCEKSRNKRLDFYYCQYCNGYHITSRIEFVVGDTRDENEN